MPRMRKPACSIIARIAPAWPFFTASGLIIANVCSMYLQSTLDLFSNFSRGCTNRDPGVFHRFDFVLGFSRATRNDRARVAHTAPGRCSLPGNETDHRLAHACLDIRCRGLLGIAADLADHDDRVRVVILIEHANRVDEVGPDNRIAADADTCRLADAESRQLAYGFVGQRAGARHNADVSFEMNVARHDSDLALAR